MQYIDTLSISMRDFYAKTGISRGTLESESSITEVTLAKFIVFYPEINPTWLLTGNGHQFIDPGEGEGAPPEEKAEIGGRNNKEYNDRLPNEIQGCNMCIMKDKLIQSQENQIETLFKLVNHLEKNTEI